MAVASLVLGIISIVLSFFPGLSIWGAIVGIVGIVLGVLGKKVPEQAGMAKAGLVCSIIGTVLCLAFYVACVACISSAGGMMYY